MIEADMAWDSKVRPNRIVFKHKTPADISYTIFPVISEIFPEVGSKDVSLTSIKPVTDPAGHFCMRIGTKKWFLRVTRRQRKNPDMEEVMAFYLSNAGIKVNLPIASDIKVTWRGRSYLLNIFPYIEGRHYNGSDSDLKSLSTVIARMHKILKSFKFAKHVYSAALKTADRLAEVKKMISHLLITGNFSMFYERSDWARRNFKWLKTMIDYFDPYLCLMPQAQCVHGELHLGNVMFSLHDGSIILTDFEEVCDAWFPPSFDLAYLVHRFCMDGVNSKLIFQKKLKILKKNYGELPSDLEEMSHQVCWYNIALLIDKSVIRKSIAPEEEYSKFMNLEYKTTFLFS